MMEIASIGSVCVNAGADVGEAAGSGTGTKKSLKKSKKPIDNPAGIWYYISRRPDGAQA